MIRLDAAPRTVGHVAIDRQHNTRTVQLFGNLRRGNADHATMPTFARDDGNERSLGSVVKFFYRQIDDLLLNSLAFLVSRVEVFSELSATAESRVSKSSTTALAASMRPAALIRGPSRKPRSYAVMPSPQLATLMSAFKPGFADARSFISATIVRFSPVSLATSANADGHNLQKCRNLRLAATFAKQGVDEFERDADTREVLSGYSQPFWFRIEHGKGWWSLLSRGEMVIGDDYVETVVAGPVKRFVRANAAVDTHD